MFPNLGVHIDLVNYINAMKSIIHTDVFQNVTCRSSRMIACILWLHRLQTQLF